MPRIGDEGGVAQCGADLIENGQLRLNLSVDTKERGSFAHGGLSSLWVITRGGEVANGCTRPKSLPQLGPCKRKVVGGGPAGPRGGWQRGRDSRSQPC